MTLSYACLSSEASKQKALDQSIPAEKQLKSAEGSEHKATSVLDPGTRNAVHTSCTVLVTVAPTQAAVVVAV